jgi:hypothetical protein
MLGPVEIVLRGGLIVLHRPAPESLEHSPHQHFDVAVVSMVVLGDGFAEPGVVQLARRLPGLALAERPISRRHRCQPPEK